MAALRVKVGSIVIFNASACRYLNQKLCNLRHHPMEESTKAEDPCNQGLRTADSTSAGARSGRLPPPSTAIAV